jgi:hypothetical protein
MGSANTAVAYDIEGDGFFITIEEVNHAQVEHVVPDPLIGETDMLREETHMEELFNGSGPEDWLDQEGEELLIAEETASAMLTKEDSSPTPVPSSRSKSKLAPHMALHAPVSNCMLDEERYCAYSGCSDLELVHPHGDGAGQAVHTTHCPMGHISDTSVHQLVAGWLKGMLLEWA